MELVQTTFDYRVLSPEQAERTQDRELRIIGRTQKAIIENGKDLLAVKADIGHGHFRSWVQTLGISHDTAERWINIAQNFGEMTPGASLAEKAMALLSTSKVPESARQEAKERTSSGEKITEETAKQIRDAHKAKEEAEKKAASTQQQFDLFSQLSEGKIGELNKQITELQEKIETLSTPEKVEVTPQAVLNDIATMKAQIEKLTEQKALLSQKSTELAEDLKKERAANKARRDQERYEAQIKDGWKKATDELYKALSKFNGQLPSPIDLQVFEGDEWARYAKIEEALRFSLLRQGSQFCDQLPDSWPAGLLL